jgi:tol-pal system protein YbgF
MERSRARALLGVLCASAALGCARAETVSDRNAGQMHDQLARVQADGERMGDAIRPSDGSDDRLEKVPQRPRGKKPAPPSPDVKSVRITPDGSAEAQTSGETASALAGEDPEDTTPRPSIRVQGFPGAPAARGKRSAALAPPKIEANIPDEEPAPSAGPSVKPNAPKASALDPDAKRAYDAALAHVNAKKYSEALEAFAGFLVKWPDHPYADNAMYWRGESYYAQADYTRASAEFEGLVTRFPVGNKVPDALLKAGLCQQKLGNAAKAKTFFERLAREFPRSEAARRIPADNPARREVNP